MINLEKKIEELAEKYGEPGKGAEGRYLHERKALHECCPPVLGVVTDNRDPEGRARTGKGEHGHERARERKPLALCGRAVEKERQRQVGTAGNRNPGSGGVHIERQEPGIRPGVHI